jgi:hypothetical protein
MLVLGVKGKRIHGLIKLRKKNEFTGAKRKGAIAEQR